jgi:hypothetical protein
MKVRYFIKGAQRPPALLMLNPLCDQNQLFFLSKELIAEMILLSIFYPKMAVRIYFT